MNRLDILKDGPFRHVHVSETCELLTTLVKVGSKFVEEEGEDAPVAHTLREWKAILVRRIH